jgi:hypothetical protein
MFGASAVALPVLPAGSMVLGANAALQKVLASSASQVLYLGFMFATDFAVVRNCGVGGGANGDEKQSHSDDGRFHGIFRDVVDARGGTMRAASPILWSVLHEVTVNEARVVKSTTGR